MSCHVAFIRAVMLGRGGVDREALIDAFMRAGAISARSHIATGNVTFDASSESAEAITAAVEADLVSMAGTPKKLFVRSAPELRALARAAPFATWAHASAAHELAVIFLADPTELPFASHRYLSEGIRPTSRALSARSSSGLTSSGGAPAIREPGSSAD